jgi:HPt (histidine-containing phosphotransfer) domain-containing protein
VSSFESRMAALGERFRQRAIEDAARLRKALAVSDSATLLSLSHGLAGTAGIFGHRDLGDAAEQLEVAIDEASAPAEIASRCRALLIRLDAVAGQRD